MKRVFCFIVFFVLVSCEAFNPKYVAVGRAPLESEDNLKDDLSGRQESGVEEDIPKIQDPVHGSGSAGESLPKVEDPVVVDTDLPIEAKNTLYLDARYYDPELENPWLDLSEALGEELYFGEQYVDDLEKLVMVFKIRSTIKSDQSLTVRVPAGFSLVKPVPSQINFEQEIPILLRLDGPRAGQLSGQLRVFVGREGFSVNVSADIK